MKSLTSSLVKLLYTGGNDKAFSLDTLFFEEYVKKDAEIRELFNLPVFQVI